MTFEHQAEGREGVTQGRIRGYKVISCPERIERSQLGRGRYTRIPKAVDDWYRASIVRMVDGGSTKYQQPAQVKGTGDGTDN